MNQRPRINTPTDLGTVLSVWAHPDDETFQSGGLMAAAAAAGQRVVCVSATAGEHGTDDPDAWPPERLGRVRRWEAAAAMAALGVADHRWLDYGDGQLAGLDPVEPVCRLAALIDEVRPDTILTFGPDGGTFHSDHQTVSAWVGAAWEATDRTGRLLHSAFTEDHLERWLPLYEEWSIFMTDERPVGVTDDALAIGFHLDPVLLDRKIAALCAMHTQLAPTIAAVGLETLRHESNVEYFVDAPV